MITALVHFALRPGITLEEAIEEVRHTIPIYEAEPALIRKQIGLDPENGEGFSVYLWKDRGRPNGFSSVRAR